MHRIALFLTAAFALVGCSSRGGPYPSLQPRAAEQIDPRVLVTRPMNDRPATPALVAKLQALVSQARDGEGIFSSAASQAERLAQAAGALQSDSWVAAQEALSAAVAARRPAADALSQIDAIGASTLQGQGGLAPSDLAAIQSAGAEAGAIDERQAARIKAIQHRLGG